MRRIIAFALNEWDDKDDLDDWAKRHGYSNASGIARRKFYEYLSKCHYSQKNAPSLNHGKKG